MYLLIEGWYESSERLVHGETIQLILTNIERSPHVVHHGNSHNRRARTNQFTLFGIDIHDLASHLGNLNGLVDVRCHLVHRTLSTPHHSGSSHLLFTTSTIARHLILTLCSLVLSFQSLILSIGLITLLGTHHALIEQTLHTLIRLLGNLQSSLRLLHQLEGALNLLLTGTIASHLILSRRSILSTTGLFHLSAYLRGIEDG